MAIVLQPLSSSAPGPVTPEDLIVVGPEDAKNAYDCPVIMKPRTVLVDRGQEATIAWEVRDRAGQAVDLTSTNIDGAILVRFADALGCDREVYEVAGTITSPAQGLIEFDLPAAVVARSSIYNLQVGVYDADEKLQFTNKGLLSVEPGLFQSPADDFVGPITIGEIRIRLRDTLVENDLLDRVEFSDSEIIAAIVDPLRYWNEIPPPIGQADARTFYWHYHWTRGTIAQLLRTAAAWYMRNSMRVDHGGMQDDDRNKYREYLALAQLYDQEWKEFVMAKKMSINMSRMWGSIP